MQEPNASLLLPRARRRVTPVAAAILVTVFATMGALPGCSGTCASNCPEVLFVVAATVGENLDVATATWAGPGCPTAPPGYCQGDAINGLACVRLFILGSQPGACQLDLTFNDGRAPFSVTTQFGPETHQGCCHGFPVVGPVAVTIPPLHPEPTDAGADGSSEAGAALDAGPADVAVGVRDDDGSSTPDSGNDST